MARPLLPIRADQVAFLARRGLSVAEIAGFFRCDRGTLYKRFGAELLQVRSEGPIGGAGSWTSAAPAAKLPPCFGPACTMYGD